MTIMIIITIFIASFLIFFSYTISHKNIYPITFTSLSNESDRHSQYECGLETLEEEIGKETRERFYIKFYIIGILFLIFDLETLLLFPASLYFAEGEITAKAFIVLVLFILILLLGLYYEYRKNLFN